MMNSTPEFVTEDSIAPVILYTGMWFPLGINNIGTLGQRLFDYYVRLENDKPEHYRSGSVPERRGNDLVWRVTLSINTGGSNYPCDIHLVWHGSGYLRCKSTIRWDQDGNSVNSPSAELVRRFGVMIDNFLGELLAKCMLPHQNNYARNVLFGKGIAFALDDFDPHSIHVDRDTKARIAEMRRGGTTISASDPELIRGIRYLMFKTIVFATMDGKILSEYNEDFAFSSDFRIPLPKDSVYRKGRYEPAYNFSAIKEADREPLQSSVNERYRERRGTIALRRTFPTDWVEEHQEVGKQVSDLQAESKSIRRKGDILATDELVDYLICLNSGIQLSSLLSAEMSHVRRNMIKSRQYLVGHEDADENIEDFVVFVETKLPLLNEVIDFVDVDFRQHLDRLRAACTVELRFLGGHDKYVLDYYSTHEASLNTLKRIASGLRYEIVSLSDYIETQLQQDSVRIAQESRLATVRSLDTQSTLAEFQRASILKGSRTKFLSALTASAFVSAQGVWTNVAIALWNVLALLQTHVINPLLGSTRQLPSDPTPAWNIFIQITGYLLVAFLIGRIILFIERGIPDIVQASADLDVLAPLGKVNDFLRTKNIKSYRKDGDKVKVVWSDSIQVHLSLEQGKVDLVVPKSVFARQYNKLRLRRYRRANSVLRTVSRQCSYHLEYDILSTQSNSALDSRNIKASIIGLSVTVDRNSEEALDAYIYPNYVGLATVLTSIVSTENLDDIRAILDESSISHFRRHGLDISQIVKSSQSSSE